MPTMLITRDGRSMLHPYEARTPVVETAVEYPSPWKGLSSPVCEIPSLSSFTARVFDFDHIGPDGVYVYIERRPAGPHQRELFANL